MCVLFACVSFNNTSFVAFARCWTGDWSMVYTATRPRDPEKDKQLQTMDGGVLH